MSNEVKATATVPLGTILFIVFLVLKLTGNINWSWWWVFSPIWIPLCIALIFILIVYLVNR